MRSGASPLASSTAKAGPYFSGPAPIHSGGWGDARCDTDLTLPAFATQVRVHDHNTGEHAWCEVTGRPTPAGPQRNCFATKKGELWTLELRLEHNGAKIGQLVADLSKPSIASLWDVKVRVYRPLPM